MDELAFRQGYQAAYEGNMNCPYDSNSNLAKFWWVGYEEGRIDRKNGR